jgi:hypothetical protein
VQDKTPELWHPDTGERSKQLVYTNNEDGITFDMTLEEHASIFVVFTTQKKPLFIESLDGKNTLDKIEDDTLYITSYEDGSYAYINAENSASKFSVAHVPPADRIEGEWKLSFLNKDMGAPDSTKTEELKSLTAFEADGIRYYSGITRYEIDFDLEKAKTDTDIRAFLDLGELWLLADISINGTSAGTLWKNPYQIEITDLIKPGENHLVIDIANTWCNRLIGDALNPQDIPYCKTNIDGHEAAEGTDWTKTPLRKSGLLGPVKIFYARKLHVPMNLQADETSN